MKKNTIIMITLFLLTGCNMISKNTNNPATKNRPEEPFSNVIGETFVRSDGETPFFKSFADEYGVLMPINGNVAKTFSALTEKSPNFMEIVGEKKQNISEFSKDIIELGTEREITYEYLGETPFFFSSVNEFGKDDKRVLDGNAYMWLPMFYFDKEGTMRMIYLGRLLFVFDVGVEESKTREKKVYTNGPMEYLQAKYPEMVVDGIGLINARGEQEGGTYPRIVLEKAADFLMQDQERMDEFMNMGKEDYQEVIAIYREYQDVDTLSYFKYTKETYEELYGRLIGAD